MVLTVSALLLVGCEALTAGGCERRFPRDIEVELVRVADEATYHRVTGDRNYRRSTRSAILVEVSSATDWVRRAARSAATVWLKAYFCEEKERMALLASPYLYVNGKFARATLEGGVPNLPQRDGEGRYVVEGFLSVRYEGRAEVPDAFRLDPDQKYYDRFNLETHPRDVCFHVSGGTLLLPLFDYRSNVAVVRKDEIARVLDGDSASSVHQR